MSDEPDGAVRGDGMATADDLAARTCVRRRDMVARHLGISWVPVVWCEWSSIPICDARAIRAILNRNRGTSRVVPMGLYWPSSVGAENEPTGLSAAER